MPDPRCSDRPVAAARRFLARAAHRLVSAAGLILACAGPASATPFVYEISFGYWYSFFDPQFQYAGLTGTFAYDPATLVPLTPPSSPNERVTYVVGAGTALEVTTGTDHALLVQGASSERVGEIAFAAGVPVHELVNEGEVLEDIFLELTSEASA